MNEGGVVWIGMSLCFQPKLQHYSMLSLRYDYGMCIWGLLGIYRKFVCIWRIQKAIHSWKVNYGSQHQTLSFLGRMI
jgi:hypothetical protein